jgi:hypothetical protein
METTVIRVREPREVLAYVAYRLGFRPTWSLVAVSLRGSGREVGLVVRVDLGDLADDSSGNELARTLAAHVARDGARHAFLLLYAEAPRADVRAGVGAAGVALSRMRAALSPGLVADAWLVSSSGYAGIDCDDEECCPADGRPLGELESTRVAAEMVLRGSLLAETRGDLALTSRAAPHARRTAGRAAAEERATRRGLVGQAIRDGSPDPLEQWAERGMARWARLRQAAEQARPLPPAALGRLLVALEDARLRDEMILAVVEAADTAHASGRRPALDALFTAGSSAPDPRVVSSAKQVLAAVVAHAPRGRVAPGLTVLAWLAWWEGDGARASVLADQALGTDASYRLARLLAAVLAQGLPPGWARATAFDAASDRADRPGSDDGGAFPG